MDRGDWWITRIPDNRVRGLIGELVEAIAECEDPEVVYRLRSSLSIGLANFASQKERSLRALGEDAEKSMRIAEINSATASTASLRAAP